MQIPFPSCYFVLSFLCCGGSLGCSRPQHLECLQSHIHQEKNQRHHLIFQTYMCHQSAYAEIQASFLGDSTRSENGFVSQAARGYYHPLKLHCQSASQSPSLVMHLSVQFPPYTNYTQVYKYFPIATNKAVLCIADNRC